MNYASILCFQFSTDNSVETQLEKSKQILFFQIPESSKLPLPVVPRRPHPRQSLSSKDLGERVIVLGEKRGFLRFIGPTHFESGEWCGIELDLPEGKNDGRVEGEDYFHCLPNHGLFVPSHFVELLKGRKTLFRCLIFKRKPFKDLLTHFSKHSRTLDIVFYWDLQTFMIILILFL